MSSSFGAFVRRAYVLAVCLSLPAVLDGQSPASLRTNLVGVVRDSAGAPLSDATVYVTELHRSVRSRADGTFRFPDLVPGTYTLGARLLGYLGTEHRLRLDTGSVSIVIELLPTVMGLPSVTTRASRGGLSGSVRDVNGAPIVGAEVRALAAGVGGATTDSVGEFFLPVKGGRYLMRVERRGYRRQLISVTVPPREGRRVETSLSLLERAPNPIEGANLFDMQQRLIRANPVWARFVTREDLLKFGATTAKDVAQRFTASLLEADECAKLDGGPSEAPLWAIDVSEIEFMETTAQSPRRRYGLIGNGNSRQAIASATARPVCRHIIWLRK